MTGGLDEFRESIECGLVEPKQLTTSVSSGQGRGRLIAWSQPIAKGTTLRGMWYYSRPEHDKSCIWFFTVRLIIARALRVGLLHVDAGPSDNGTVAFLKKKYGFHIDEKWRETVSYAGDFVELCEAQAAERSPVNTKNEEKAPVSLPSQPWSSKATNNKKFT